MSNAESYHWWAIIGPIPSPTVGGFLVTPHDQTRRLAGTAHVGPLRLNGADTPLVEWLTCEPHTLFGVSKFVSWPIIAESADGGERGTPAHREASRLLHRLVCLLAVGWDEPWQERCTPQSAQSLSPQIPESWPPPPFWHGAPGPDLSARDEPLPSWIPAAWDSLASDDVLSGIASFWHQGLLASPRHPSLAAVAYTAAIERAAFWLAAHGDERIPAGSGRRRVDAAIALVADEDEAELLKPLYAARSRTAHGGRLHGIETVTGAFFSLKYIPGDIARGIRPVLQSDLTDPLQMFTRRLQTARSVARRLIMHALGVQQAGL